MCFHEIKNRRRRAFHINRRCPICHATVNADRAAPIRNGFIRCAAILRISAARAGKTARRSSFIKSCLNPAAARAARSARSPCASPAPVIPMGRFSPCARAAAPSLDERLVISGLEPGCYAIEELLNRPNEYCTTITGPVMGNVVQLTNSCVPTVVTIVNRKRLCRRRYCGG